MERDCILAQGASGMLLDRLKEQSDETRIWVCDICGLIAVADKTGRGECKVCETNKISRISISYGTKLIIQELFGMGIVARILTSPHDPPRVVPMTEEEKEKILPLSKVKTRLENGLDTPAAKVVKKRKT